MPDYYDIIAQHRKEVGQLQQEARDIAKTWSPFDNAGFGLEGIFSWLKDIVLVIVMIFILALILYLCFKCCICIIACIQSPHNKVLSYMTYMKNHQAIVPVSLACPYPSHSKIKKYNC